MTSAEDLPPEERKRQREALRRRLAGPGLRPGLIQKFAAATTSHAKWEFLKAFMLDPQCLGDITIEAEYVSLAEREDTAAWEELPLETLKKMYTTQAETQFLEQQVVAKQKGRAHPQSPDDPNPNMRLYWVFKQNSDLTRNKNSIGTRTLAKGKVPQNKAAMGAVTDALTGFSADFGGKGAHDEVSGGKGDGKKGNKKADQAEKKRKARVLESLAQSKIIFYSFQEFQFGMGAWTPLAIWYMGCYLKNCSGPSTCGFVARIHQHAHNVCNIMQYFTIFRIPSDVA